jgi:hypothetical protein
MTSAGVPYRTGRLPSNRDLALEYAFSLVVAVIMAVASVVGLLYSTTLYPTEVLVLSYLPSDAFNLVIGLPFLLGSLWLARRGKLVGLLCWPGALFYVLYMYIPYVVGVPFNVLFLAYLLLVVLSAYTLIGLVASVASIDGEAVRQRLSDRPHQPGVSRQPRDSVLDRRLCGRPDVAYQRDPAMAAQASRVRHRRRAVAGVRHTGPRTDPLLRAPGALHRVSDRPRRHRSSPDHGRAVLRAVRILRARRELPATLSTLKARIRYGLFARSPGM